MPSIAIVGAGPGLGLSIAKKFGHQGYDVALISRNRSHVDGLATELGALGITAVGYAADVADRQALTEALDAAAERFDGIDVLEISPYAGLEKTYPAELTVDQLSPQIEGLLYGAVTAVNAVLPRMIANGAGTLLFTSGAGSIEPLPFLASLNIVQAAIRNYSFNLHSTLADQGIYAGHVPIGVMIGDTAPPGVAHAPADEIAELYWAMHTQRSHRERTFPA